MIPRHFRGARLDGPLDEETRAVPLDEVNLKRGTVRLVEEQRNVVLSRLDKEDRKKGGMF